MPPRTRLCQPNTCYFFQLSGRRKRLAAELGLGNKKESFFKILDVSRKIKIIGDLAYIMSIANPYFEEIRRHSQNRSSKGKVFNYPRSRRIHKILRSIEIDLVGFARIWPSSFLCVVAGFFCIRIEGLTDV